MAMFEEFGINAGYVEDLHTQWLRSPQVVDERWRNFFADRTRGGSADAPAPERAARVKEANGADTNGAHARGPSIGEPPARERAPNGHAMVTLPIPPVMPSRPPSAMLSEEVAGIAALHARVYQLVNAYRVRGHLFAHLDPLDNPPKAAPELELANFGLSTEDLDEPFPTVGIAGLPPRATLREIIGHLEETYCRSIGVEFTQIEEPEMRAWLQERMESTRNRCAFSREEMVHILTKLTDAEIFEQFIAKNFVNAKRFSLEGAESVIPLLDLLIEAAGSHGLDEIVIGMAHRGRLNVLANILGKNVREIFAAFADTQPERFLGAGDVKYHLGHSTDIITTAGAKVHLSMTFNPSHLEWVNPVVEGRVRAKQERRERSGVMALLIHGDAAFMGQGVVAETLNLAGLEGYSTAGTVHVVINNQIGFTTLPEDSRSTRYCTDISRMMKVPVFHVNGEDPEAVVQVTRLAIEWRQRFGKDVIIDMYCYRKYGHNEGDEPRYTQPLMYSLIDGHPSVREEYVGRLIGAQQITRAEADSIEHQRKKVLEEAYVEAKRGDYLRHPNAMEGLWSDYVGGKDELVNEVPTHVPMNVLLHALEHGVTMPEGFKAHPKVIKALEQRLERGRSGKGIDWGTAEYLAFATLLMEGRPVRLSGQDARRGTFTHRHAVLHDVETGERHTPLSTLKVGQGSFQVWDSPLSEAGVLGFEYGYSLDCPEGLVLWEAQFGDFTNSAQVIVDQFIVSAEDKWLRLSGLVLLLPHGYEGQGPEHSSARLERFMQMAAEDNIQVCNFTTPAQLFHALRRQVIRPWRKPLVIMTPKSLLRHPEAVSPLEDLAAGHYQRVLEDPSVDPSQVTRILLCSGKVYYDLLAMRQKLGRKDVAILRLEQLYPLNDEIVRALAPFRDGTPLRWVQEEPRNAGAWYFMHANLPDIIGTRLPLSSVSRAPNASPATGSKASHDLEQKMLIEEAFAR